jgi:hypothetical protein
LYHIEFGGEEAGEVVVEMSDISHMRCFASGVKFVNIAGSGTKKYTQ